MTQIKFYAPVKEMNGEFEKGSGIVMRKKKYRAPNGAVLREGVQESYKIVHPRDYDKNPPKGAELANIQLFGDSKRQTSEIINSGKVSDEELAAMSSEQRAQVMQHLDQLTHFKQRFKISYYLLRIVIFFFCFNIITLIFFI